MSSRRGRTRTDLLLEGLLKDWAGQSAPPPALRRELLRKARQPRPFRFGRLFWFWVGAWPVTAREDGGSLFVSAGMNSLAHELLALRLVA